MKLLHFAVIFLAAAATSADYHGSDMVMNILTQFLAAPTTERETTTQTTGLLPKILNPLHWIPNFENIPWNPDSELTTVSCGWHFLHKNSKNLLFSDGDCSQARLFS